MKWTLKISILQECEEKLTGFEIQEEYHAADLRKELSNIKKILIDEKRRSNGDTVKINELQTMFGAAMKAYQGFNWVHDEKKKKLGNFK